MNLASSTIDAAEAETGQSVQSEVQQSQLLSVENVSLSFGGVDAISDISFDIREGEIRALIGPNGAGKTSLLNVINGFYHPQKGVITFRGKKRRRMKPYQAAASGIARTFQNVALFKGMSTLDNIMSGRSLKMHRGLVFKSELSWVGLWPWSRPCCCLMSRWPV